MGNMEAQNTRHELSNIYWTALFNLGAKTFMKSHWNFYIIRILSFLKDNWQNFLKINILQRFWKFPMQLWKCYEMFLENLSFTKVRIQLHKICWPQLQMGFVYICQEWLSKIGTAHMRSMDQGSLNTTVSWQ
jgi:hypothetical protein